MILFGVTLLLLHQGHTLVPVTTAKLGEPATLTCVLPDEKQSSSELHWYKQSAGDTLKLIVKLFQNGKPSYGPESSSSRFTATYEENVRTLTILNTVQDDEGMYHCAINDWDKSKWNGMYLSITGNTVRTSNSVVIQQTQASNPGQPDITLECSVLYENETCSDDLSVFWFRDVNNKSHPDILYTVGNRQDECEKKSATQKKCVFFKNVSSSDTGTYYCAVATCGEILFGKGTNLEADPEFTGLVIAICCLALSVIINIVFICYQRAACKRKESTSPRAIQNSRSHPGDHTAESGQDLNYAALNFSGGKSARGKKKEVKTEESVYSQVKQRL